MANNLMRFDPVRELTRFDPLGAFDDLLNNFGTQSLLRNMDVGSLIKLDVTETDAQYLVEAEMPGVNKDDIKVDIRGDQVSINVESKREKEEKKGSMIRTERYYGQQHRSFTLAQEVDEGKAEAKYSDGILTLTLPKKQNAGSHKQLVVH